MRVVILRVREWKLARLAEYTSTTGKLFMPSQSWRAVTSHGGSRDVDIAFNWTSKGLDHNTNRIQVDSTEPLYPEYSNHPSYLSSMTWKWNRKRVNSLMEVNKTSSTSSLSPAEIATETDKAHMLKGRLAPLPGPILERISETLTADSSQHSVRFSDVEIRPYRIILGDNAWTDLPLGLDWEYDDPQRVTVQDFEESQHFRDGAYKSANDYEPLTAPERYARLRRAGYTDLQIRKLNRRRKIELVMEWAYRQNRDEPTPSPCLNGHVYFGRYVM